MKKTTFALFFGNRGFFPGEVIAEARAQLALACEKNGYGYIIMDEKTDTLLITGPNMSGKSTYMRQLAITIILAQMGSFVPASECSIPLFEKLLPRHMKIAYDINQYFIDFPL